MRTMTRNRRVFYSAAHASTVLGTDKDGNYTEPMTTYDEVTKRMGVFTPANGRADVELFGTTELYDKVITLNLTDDYLAVGSVLWVDTLPEFDAKGNVTNAYDYVVVRVAKSLNFINVAIRKVDVAY